MRQSKLEPADHIQQSGPRGRLKGYLHVLGPGLITGASDDDPSGIGTYSQTGAQFGYTQLWTALLTFPLMTAIQEMCARGHGYELLGHNHGSEKRHALRSQITPPRA